MGILYRDWFRCASISGKKTKEEGLLGLDWWLLSWWREATWMFSGETEKADCC